MLQRFDSFETPMNAAVIGASGGIGSAFVEHLTTMPDVARVFAFARRPERAPAGVTAAPIDLTDEQTIADAAAAVKAEAGSLDLVVVCAGVLHDEARNLAPEKTWRALDADQLATSFAVNATGPALAAKHFLPLLAKERKTVFAALSARVGSIEDNRIGGWYGYRASKAALNMLIRTLAIELGRRNREALCVGLHPGTVDTALSAPFQSGVPAKKLFTPRDAAGALLTVLDGLTVADSGGLFAWDGARIPY